MCAAAPGQAAPSGFWPDYYEPYHPPYRPVLSRVRKPLKPRLPRYEELAKDTRKPQGPLILAISIEKQLLKVYDANGAFAETPVSTGMRGHPTPMGVFSVIQKQKYHRSNIYSGAPMPYMQRITWSGVAMHAGVLPGYPASHGCIRMPMNFAVKMWGWTRMGARVVITPGELAPESISHPLLAMRKTAPLAAGAPDPKIAVAVTAKSDKAAVAPDLPEPGFELKSTVGHDVARPVTATQTADASGAPARPGSQLTLVDAPVVSSSAPPADGPLPAVDVDPVLPDLKKDQTRPSDTEPAQAPKPEAVAAAAKRSGQIAMFVSRKDGKLYVRQNFAPLFDVPVTIAGDRPLSTHVFTAQTDKDDASLLHWSVISMPAGARSTADPDIDERASRRRRATGAVEVKPAPLSDSAAEALDRLTVPAEAMARITEALSTGSSIIVSDQGINTGETGIGTDFIIPLH
ncbi:MAG TPA: L,D-transpeptidase family protein [Bradyrhizobium sp.]|nr:L,D-transpeptidase family protein [Bradyrhizobium sp.]